MKYLKHIINVCNPYFINNKDIYYTDFNGNFCKNENIVTKGNYSVRSNFKNILFLFNEHTSLTESFDLNTNNLKNVNAVVSVISNIENFLFVRVRKKGNYHYAKYDLKNHIIMNTYPIDYKIKLVLNNDSFISTKENTIFCNGLSSGENIWQKSFNNKIEGDLLLYEDQILISLSDESLICLSQTTGEEIWHCNDVYRYGKIIDNYFLYQLTIGRYQIIDLKSGEKKVELDMQEKNNCLKVYPNATGVNLYNGLLYFNSGGITSDIPAKIGTFNIQKQEYEWVYQINSKKPFPSYTPPIYHSGRLYILDGENVLHVFEEEKKSNEFL